MYKRMLNKQLAQDYCCSPEQIADKRNYFTEYKALEGRRRFEKQDECALKAVVVNGKLIFTGKKEIIAVCREKYENCPGAWFMDVWSFRELDAILKPYGYRLKTAHPFFLLSGEVKENTSAFEIKRYNHDEIQQFYGDERFDEAFCFDENSPDMLGVAAVSDGEILGMAGASADSPDFWQIGINVSKNAEGKHIASTLVTLITQDIIELGKVPYYGTSMSNLASQRVAANAGFEVAWVELLTEKCP